MPTYSNAQLVDDMAKLRASLAALKRRYNDLLDRNIELTHENLKLRSDNEKLARVMGLGDADWRVSDGYL